MGILYNGLIIYCDTQEEVDKKKKEIVKLRKNAEKNLDWLSRL